MSGFNMRDCELELLKVCEILTAKIGGPDANW